MMSKFFNNENGDTLFSKFTGIAEGMGANFHTFLAVWFEKVNVVLGNV